PSSGKYRARSKSSPASALITALLITPWDEPSPFVSEREVGNPTRLQHPEPMCQSRRCECGVDVTPRFGIVRPAFEVDRYDRSILEQPGRRDGLGGGEGQMVGPDFGHARRPHEQERHADREAACDVGDAVVPDGVARDVD